MTLSELKLVISADESSALRSVQRLQGAIAAMGQGLSGSAGALQTMFAGLANAGAVGASTQSFRPADGIDAYREKLQSLREEISLGNGATDTQKTLFAALAGEYGRLSAAQLSELQSRLQLRDRLEAERAVREELSFALDSERQRRAELSAQTDADRAAASLFGKAYADITDSVHQGMARQLAESYGLTKVREQLSQLEGAAQSYRNQTLLLGAAVGPQSVALKTLGLDYEELAGKVQKAVRGVAAAQDVLSAARVSAQARTVLRGVEGSEAPEGSGKRLYLQNGKDSRSFGELPDGLRGAWEQLASALQEASREARLALVERQTASIRQERDRLSGGSKREVLPAEWEGKPTLREQGAWDGLKKAQAQLLEMEQAKAAQSELDHLRAAYARLTPETREASAAQKIFGKELGELSWWQLAYAKSIAQAQGALEASQAAKRQSLAVDRELSRIQTQQAASIERLTAGAEGAQAAIAKLRGSWSELSKEQRQRLQEIGKVQPIIDAMNQVSAGVQRMFDKVFSDLWKRGFKGFFNNVAAGFQQLLQDMAQQWAKAQIVHSINSVLAGLLGAVAPTASGAAATSGAGESLTFPGFATGGFMESGRTYLVGEEGPELFVPSSSGSLVPNHRISGEGQSVTVHNHFAIQTPDAGSFRLSMGQLAVESSAAMKRALKRNG